MLTCTRITSVEYYESMARQIKREAGLVATGATLDDTAAAYARKEAAKGHREGSEAFEAAYTEAFDKALRTLQRGHSEGRDQVAYYTDNGAGESNGIWWTRRGRPGSKVPPSPTPSPFRLSADGAEVDGRLLRDLAEGRDPETLEPLVRVSANGKRSVGYDLQFAAPKSVSVLAAFAEPEVRDRIMAAHDRAVRRALNFAFDEGLIVSRTGAQGKDRTPVEEVSAAVYRHFTSRAQDPQLHSHAVLLNLSVRGDGKTGSLDNKDILRNAGGIAALYRSELASELRRELGVEAYREGRNFEVAGIPERVLEQFSKRRAEIAKAAKEAGFNTAVNREAAQVAAFETRAAKDREIPLTALEERWMRELSNAGWSPAALFEIARVDGERTRAEREGDGSREDRLGRLALAGIESVTHTEAVIEHRHLLRHVAESLQCEANADEVLAAVKGLTERGEVIRLGQTKAGEPVYSTVELVEVERAMLRGAFARQDEREFVPAATLDRVLKNRPTMREEQKAAVRHALNRDGVSVVEGSAGSGKSYAMASVAEAARDAGAEVWTIAPSWKAVDVIRTDTETAEEMARAVAGFLHRVNKGDIDLGRNAVIVADEAGMIGTKDMAKLVEAAGRAGAKLVLTGDTRQLAPVVAGAPMRALVQAVGTSRMEEIQRQRGRSESEGAWMRAASKDFAAGEIVRAMEAYDRAGAITWADDREAAIGALVQDYAAARLDPRGQDRTRAVLTGWNVDVQAINERIRAKLIEQGTLPAGQDVEIKAVPRGGNKPAALALAPGDDVIFGESVEIQGITLRNADLARIERIGGDAADPTLTFRLAKNGASITARTSELVGFREQGEARHPKIQHSYAMTTHASQGVTVDECYVANVRGMQSESTYVAMTRHRESVRLYADTSRVRDQLEAKQPAINPDERGMAKGGRGGPEAAAEISAAEIRAAFLAECAASGSKANASDFLPENADLRAWADGTQPPKAVPPVPSPTETAPDRESVISPAGLPRLPIRPGYPGWKPSGQAKAPPEAPVPPSPTPSQRAADAVRERMQSRAKAPVAYPVPEKTAAAVSRRITPEEFEAFGKIDLATFAEREGLKPIGAWERGKSGEEFRLYQDPSKADGSKVNIARWPSGKWSFAARDGSAKGGITQFMAWRDGIAPIQAAHRLRAYLGTAPDMRATVTESSRVAAVRITTPTGRVDESKPRTPEDRAAVIRRAELLWQKLGRQANDYLSKVREIAPEVLARFRAEIRTTSSGIAAFAHRDLEGRITGYEYKGAGDQDGGKRSISKFSEGGEKNFTQMGDVKNPTRIYVAESGVDGLSVYQADGQPERALVCSFYGNPSAVALDRFRALVRRHPDAEVHVAMDNDTAGRRFAAQVESKVQEARGLDAGVIDRKPGDAFKDWNDEIRGWTREDASRLRAEREAEMQAQAVREMQAAEAARIAAEEQRRIARPR